MKIICDCGKVFELKKDDWTDECGSTHCTVLGMTIAEAHDEIWITCDSCGESAHLFV